MAGGIIILHLQQTDRAFEHCVIQHGYRLLAAQVAVEAVPRVQLLLEGVQIPLSHALFHQVWESVGLTGEWESFLLVYFPYRVKEVQLREVFFCVEE